MDEYKCQISNIRPNGNLNRKLVHPFLDEIFAGENLQVYEQFVFEAGICPGIDDEYF